MKRTGWIAVGILVVVLTLVKLFFLTSSSPAKSVAAKKPPTSVGVVVVHPTPSDQIINVSGTILPWETVKLQPEINARVIHIFFNEGSKVQKGELLVKLYDDDLQAQKQKLEAQLEAAEAEYKRQTKLLEVHATSQDVYDNALTAVKGLKADLAINRAAIQKTEIRAPFDGVIGNRFISPGSVINTGTVIATIYQNVPLRLQCAVPSMYRSMLRPGLPVSFSTDHKTNHVAKVYSIEPMADANDRTFDVRIEYSNILNDIFPGDYAMLTINLGHTDNAIYVPTDAVVPILKGQLLYVARGGKAQPVHIETGERNDSTVLITNGLHAGDSVIVAGIMMMKPGAPIHISSVR